METSFTALVGCRLPLQQAGMGGTATSELALAVSEAGGLGMLGLAGVPADVVVAAAEAVAARTVCPFGVNFLIPFLDRDAVVAAAHRARVVEFFYGNPDADLVALAHEGGALVSWQVGSVEEARAAADAGCDLVVAQGVEAGGHVRGQVGLLPLLDAILEEVSVPVVAAGGLGSARAIAAVLAAGASGVRVGTRFLAAEEADVHPAYLDALVHARAEDTVLTTTFSNQWPDAPHRVLRACVAAVLDIEGDVVGHTELAPGVEVPVARLSPLSPGRRATGHVDAMAHYAGQSVDHVRHRMSAAQIVAELSAKL
jgi:NAD(P)H-dependent flavin oxidoreductase YrpB (nitropropane dioxygenase family)